MERIQHSILAFIFSCAALLISVFPAESETALPEGTVVHAGYFYNGDFMFKTENGSYSGYDVEYYYTVAGYAGWHIEFTEYTSFSEALKALERGDIDIMSGLSITGDRSSRYLVSAMSMCDPRIAVQVRADDDRFTPGYIETFDTITCGILKGSNIISIYNRWCEANGFVPHIILFNTIEMRNRALSEGKIDAIAAGSTVPGARKIAEFPSTNLYFMLNRNRHDLKKQLDRAMSILSLDNSAFPSDLFHKYFPPSKNAVPSFTAQEKLFISSHPEMTVAVFKDDAPFSHFDSNGTASGIIPDYYAHLSSLTGIRFTFIPYSSKEESCGAVSSGKTDIAGKFGTDVFDAEDRNIILTMPYLSLNMVQIVRRGAQNIKTAAVPECNMRLISSISPSLEKRSYPSGRQCFDALKSGRADAVICSQPAATWLLNRNRASDYTVTSFGSQPWNISSAVPHTSGGSTIRIILDKAIACDPNYISQLVIRDTLENTDDLSTVLDHFPVTLLASSAALFALLLGITITALIIIIRRHRYETALAARQNEVAAAEKANKARDAFFGAVSHDMRTPLNAITGFSILAQKEESPARIKEYLGKIQSSGELLSSLLNDTLTISKANAGKLELHEEISDTIALVNSVMIPVREAAAAKKISCTCTVSQGFPGALIVDRLALQKILLNLLSNAVRYTDAGGHVSLSLAAEKDTDGDAAPCEVFTVRDDGIGISPEFLPYIYEPFSQEHAPGTDIGGTGLGLSIVKELVDRMNGTISVESRQNEGSVFTVRFHLKKAAAAEASSLLPSADSTDHLSGKKILLCEDNEMNSEIACGLLRSRGMETIRAADGERGVSLFASSTEGFYAAVLMDIRMPVMNGYEASKAIRALDRRDAKTVPIIAMTADAFEDDVKRCREAGMNSHVAKPVHPETLFRELEKLIRRRNA